MTEKKSVPYLRPKGNNKVTNEEHFLQGRPKLAGSEEL